FPSWSPTRPAGVASARGTVSAAVHASSGGDLSRIREMNNIEKLQRTPSFPTIRVEADPAGTEHWLYMHADAASGARPCFRTTLMDDMWSYLTSITLRESQRRPGQLRHVVLASDADAFHLGGDLQLVARLIRAGTREQLLAYARSWPRRSSSKATCSPPGKCTRWASWTCWCPRARARPRCATWSASRSAARWRTSRSTRCGRSRSRSATTN